MPRPANRDANCRAPRRRPSWRRSWRHSYRRLYPSRPHFSYPRRLPSLERHSLPMSEFLKAVNERVVVYDGAMGTNIQFRNLTADDYWGKEGCNELLVLSRPDVIADIHAAFFGVGCDVVETQYLWLDAHCAGRVRAGRPHARVEPGGLQGGTRGGGAVLHAGAAALCGRIDWDRRPSCRRWDTSPGTRCWRPTWSRPRR